jgi:endonuclease/exonuclease/phosphatase family metal-dependent hydrolase
LKIISWNLLHTGGASAAHVQAMIAAEQPDLFLMQEATARLDTLPEAVGGFYTRDALPGRLHGLACWTRQKLKNPARTLALQRGMVVRRVCQILDFDDIGIANVHLSHGQLLNRRQLRRIARILPPRAAILGDCNMVGAPLLRGFADAGPRTPTHNAARLVPLRLDRCFTRGLHCESSKVLLRGESDHRPIMVTLSAG